MIASRVADFAMFCSRSIANLRLAISPTGYLAVSCATISSRSRRKYYFLDRIANGTQLPLTIPLLVANPRHRTEGGNIRRQGANLIVINNRGNRNNDPTFNLLLSAAVNLEHRSEISQHRAGIEFEIASEILPIALSSPEIWLLSIAIE